MPAFLWLTGATIVVGTLVLTALRYGGLPDRIAIHFSIDGTPNGYGPRFMAWLIPALQIILAALYWRLHQTGIPMMPLVGTLVLAICLGGQILILNAAASGAQRVSMRWFWIYFVGVFVLGIAGSRFIR